MSLFPRRQHPGPYGHNFLISAYLGVDSIPPGVVIQHGWTPLANALNSDLQNCKYLMLCWSERYQRQWQATSNVPSRILGAPYIHYRRSLDIQQDVAAKGTLAFPAHSTREVQAHFDLDQYCEELKALPSHFQPVAVSLYYGDILHYNLDEFYRNKGFEVVCSTAGTGKPAYESFYEQLRRFKYTTSNEPGSYSFYSIEMGIPFFILGELARRDNTHSRSVDLPCGIYTLRDFPAGDEAYAKFSVGHRDKISKEQLEYVLDETGMRNCASSSELAPLIEGISKHVQSNGDRRSLFSRVVRIVKNPQIAIQVFKDWLLYRKHFDK
ncbi:MAG: hypothetical protein ACOX9C_07855 [Kiritimatiellia bacterium]|jgi:hypothetical protein